MKKELLPEEAKRLETYNEMPTKLQDVAKRFDVKVAGATKGLVMICYDMGAELRKVIEEEAEYGANAVKQLAIYLGKSETELYTYANVARTYDKKEVQGFVDRQMASGARITWMHLTAIVEIKRAPERKKMWERIFNESLSASTVKSEALATLDKGGKRGTGGGRKPARPSSPLSGAQQIYSTFNNVNNKSEIWTETVFDTIDELEPDKIDPMYVEKLKLALGAAETASGNLNNIVDRLTKNLKRAENVVEKHKKEADKAADEASAAAAEGEGEGETKRRRRPAAAVA